MSGLAKLCLVLKNQQVPPNIHLNNPNPKIQWEKYRLQVVTKETMSIGNVDDQSAPILGCVNSFGFGGSNVHAVLRSVPEANTNRRLEGMDDGLPKLFSISGYSDATLREYATSYLHLLNEDDSSTNMSLTDICYTASARCTHCDIRLASAPASKDELKQQLDAFLAGEKFKNLTSNRVSNSKSHKVAFIFSGLGPQWFGMGNELFETHQIYRAVMLEVDAEMTKLVGWSIVEELSKSSEESCMYQTTVATHGCLLELFQRELLGIPLVRLQQLTCLELYLWLMQLQPFFIEVDYNLQLVGRDVRCLLLGFLRMKLREKSKDGKIMCKWLLPKAPS